MMPKYIKEEGGVIPIIILIAAVGLIAFLVVTNIFNFKNKLFSSLFPKPSSHAQTNNKLKDTQLENDTRDKTFNLLKLNKDYQNIDPGKKADALGQIKQASKDRKAAMLSLVDRDPDAFLRIAVSKGVKTAFPKDVQGDFETEVTEEGTFQIIHADNFKDKKSQDTPFLKTSNNKWEQLVFNTQTPSIKPGTKIRVKGVNLDDKIVLQPVEQNIIILPNSVLGVNTASLPPTNYKVLVLIFRITGTRYAKDEPWSFNFVNGKTFTDPDSVAAYYKENTFNKINLYGDFNNEYVPISPTALDCTLDYQTRFFNTSLVASNYMTNKGINTSQYSKFIYAVPDQCNAQYGIAQFYGTESYIVQYQTDNIVHELGHNFGADHSDIYGCSEPGIGVVPISTSNNCTQVGYGDPFDAMSTLNSHTMNALNKGRLETVGALDPNNIQTLPTSATPKATYNLAPINIQSSAVSVIRIPRVVNFTNPASISQYYYLEYRQPFGKFDNFSPNEPVTTGISVRLGPDFDYCNDVICSIFSNNLSRHSLLIDPRPKIPTQQVDNSNLNYVLGVGQTLIDTYGSPNTIKITPKSVNSSQAQVEIETTPNNQCNKANPTVTIVPKNRYFTPIPNLTSIVGYNLYIKNEDPGNCPDSTFNLSFTSNTAFLKGDVQQGSAMITSITLKPGTTSQLLNLILTPGTLIPLGLYTFTLTATNSVDAKFTGSDLANLNVAPMDVSTSIDVYFNVIADDKTPPVVSIIYPVNGGFVGAGSTTFIEVDATDNVGVVGVKVFINGVLAGTAQYKGPAYTFDWVVPSRSGSAYTIKANACDAKNNCTDSVTVGVTAK